MRTTLDLDAELLSLVTRRYPPGTPKTVIIEESIRLALRVELPSAAGRPSSVLPVEVAQLVAKGVLRPATWSGVPPQGTSASLPAGALVRDLSQDRDER